jgi:hypothetical protein
MVAMKAIRKLWQTNEMPRKRSIVRFKRHFSQAEFDRLSFGEVPQQMEDKWFIFLEDSWLFFHRSWTGDCIFQLRLQTAEHGYDVVEAWVNREVQQYNSGGPASELELLSQLIKRLLLENS